MIKRSLLCIPVVLISLASNVLAEWRNVELYKLDTDLNSCNYRVVMKYDLAGSLRTSYLEQGGSTSFMDGATERHVLRFKVSLDALAFEPGFRDAIIKGSDGIKKLFNQKIDGEPSANGSPRAFTPVEANLIRTVSAEYAASNQFSLRLTSYVSTDANGYASKKAIDTINVNSDKFTLQENCPVSYRIPGDANLDGKVDSIDGEIVTLNFNPFPGATARTRSHVRYFTKTWKHGDFDGDGNVGWSDFYVWYVNYLKMVEK